MALNVALPSPLASRLGENASSVTESTRKSGFASSVQVHWLWVELPRAWETRVTLPGRYWPIAAELTTPQALGTEWHSPGWNVVTSPLSLELGAGLLWNGSFPRTPSTTATPTTTTRPAMMISRRAFLALAAAALRLRPRPGPRPPPPSQGARSSSASCGPLQLLGVDPARTDAVRADPARPARASSASAGRGRRSPPPGAGGEKPST